MQRRPYSVLILILFPAIHAKDPELPLCPPHVQFFPQNLPMHCRMPTNQDFLTMAPPPGFPPNIFGPSPVKVPASPGIQGPMPAPMQAPMPMPMPMAMPMAPGPAHKLPVVVMPFYSPDNSFKKKRERKHKRPRPYPSTDDSSDTDTSTDGSTDTSDEYEGWWRRSNDGRKSHPSHHHKQKQKRKKHRQVKDFLTPVLQYVTKDGYVIYEKQISKGEATDWMNVKNGNEASQHSHTHEHEHNSSEHREDNNENQITNVEKRKEELHQDKSAKKHPKKAQRSFSKP